MEYSLICANIGSIIMSVTGNCLKSAYFDHRQEWCRKCPTGSSTHCIWGESLVDFLLAPVCSIEKVTLWVDLCLMS